MMKLKTIATIAVFVVAAAVLSTAKSDTSDKGKIAGDIQIVGYTPFVLKRDILLILSLHFLSSLPSAAVP